MLPLNLGRVIREQREERGYTIRDLADKQISTGTISKIENSGDCQHIQQQKLNIYLAKLGLTMAEIKKLAKQDDIKKKTLHFRLTAIESNIEAGTATAADINNIVKEFNITPLHPYYTTTRYLHGKRLFKKRKLDKAKISFCEALTDRSPEDNDYLNVAAGAYNQLAYILYLENNINKALICIDKGLKKYIENGHRQHVKPTLLINKAVYLEKLGNIDGAEEILEQLVCPSLDIVKKAYNYVLLHQVKADILVARGRYGEALEFLERGIELARVNRLYNLQCSLWMTLGNLCYYHDLIGVQIAEDCFKQALKLKTKVDNKQLLISAYRKLGCVYMRTGQQKKARENIIKAIQLAKKHKDVLRHIDSLIALGRWYDSQSLKLEAEIKYKEALNLALKYDYLNKKRKIEKLLQGGFHP